MPPRFWGMSSLDLTLGAGVVAVCLLGCSGGWRVEGEAQPDLDVPAGDADVFDEQAQQLLFLDVVEGVDDGVDAGGEVMHAARSWLSRASAVRSSARLVRLCCSSFRREETSVARRCISGSSINPPW